MRALLAALSMIAIPLAGADGASARRVMRAAPAITLAGNGLVVRGSLLRFGTPRGQAQRIVTAPLGPVTEDAVDPECGVGHPIASASYASGLELSFVRGRFVGWTVNYGGDRRILTANRVGLGMTLAMLKRLGPMVTIEPGND